MSENTKLWDILGRTDPKHTKSFTRGGGFKGTAIKPMFSYLRLTEQFGPCGTGWGVNEPSFQVVSGDNREVLVYCTVAGWYMLENERRMVFGVGGDKVVSYIKANEQYNRPERWENDDEAFKKAFTDALTNAFKLVGVGADVHMGLFDDSKYVNSMREEFADPPANEPPRKENGKPEQGWREDGTRTSFALKKEQPELMADLDRELDECQTLIRLERLKDAYREKAGVERWNKSFMNTMKEMFDRREQAIMAETDRLASLEPEELSQLDPRTAFEHSAAMNNLRAG